jgi:hypothetical protein
VPFQYVGVANEFSTALKNSFSIANADYVATASHDTAANVFLIDTQGQNTSATVARWRSALGTGLPPAGH